MQVGSALSVELAPDLNGPFEHVTVQRPAFRSVMVPRSVALGTGEL